MKSFYSAGLGLVLVASLTCATHAYDEIVVKNGGTVRGAVKLQGELPKLPPLEITKYKEVCKDVPNEAIVAGPGQGLRYAVITLEGISQGKATEKEAVHELDNIGCRFVPHVMTASVGQFVRLKNSDPILHTAHAYFGAGQPQFNVGLYPGRVTRKPLITPGIAKIVCELHPWMKAYIVVTEHPYHSVTDTYGEYDIADIPAGLYRLKVWHEVFGSQEKKVEVKAGTPVRADFAFTPMVGTRK